MRRLSMALAAALLPALAAAQGAGGRADAVYLGWRSFQAHCARCHGADAGGTTQAPNLLERVKGMSEGRFAAAVLQRYRWVVPAADAAREGAAREALLDEVMRRREAEVTMPAWQDEPAVRARVLDLHAWLDARANGRVGAGRPPAK